MSVPRLSVRRPVAVAMLALAVVLLGLVSLIRLPVDLLPAMAYPTLVIHTALGRCTDDRCRLEMICRSTPFSAPIMTRVGTLITMSY